MTGQEVLMKMLSFYVFFTVKMNHNFSTSSLQNRPNVNLLDCKDTIDMKQLCWGGGGGNAPASGWSMAGADFNLEK